MPLLWTWLANAFAWILGWAAQYFSKRVANYVAIGGLTAAAYAVAWVGVQALLAGIQVATPIQVTYAANWFVPSNFDELIAARIGLEVVVGAYRWHKETLRAAAYVM